MDNELSGIIREYAALARSKESYGSRDVVQSDQWDTLAQDVATLEAERDAALRDLHLQTDRANRLHNSNLDAQSEKRLAQEREWKQRERAEQAEAERDAAVARAELAERRLSAPVEPQTWADGTPIDTTLLSDEIRQFYTDGDAGGFPAYGPYGPPTIPDLQDWVAQAVAMEACSECQAEQIRELRERAELAEQWLAEAEEYIACVKAGSPDTVPCRKAENGEWVVDPEWRRRYDALNAREQAAAEGTDD